MKNVLIFALAVLLASSANAAIVSYSDTIGSTATNWNGTVSLPQYNPADFGYATLTSIEITLNSDVAGIIEFESRDTSPSTVTAALAAHVTMNNVWASLHAMPSASVTESVTAYDGVLDFAGDSGRTFGNLSGTDTITVVLTDLAALAAFTGTGNIDFGVLAVGASSGSGPGNLVLGFTTLANAKASVTYIPEPMTVSLLALGGLTLLRRRR